jgi:hypothetical protein
MVKRPRRREPARVRPASRPRARAGRPEAPGAPPAGTRSVSDAPPRFGRPPGGRERPEREEALGLERVIGGRRRQHRIDLRLALGSIIDVDAPAYVLGVFRDVAPSGAARALDERLGGAIGEFTARRMLSGGVGEIFMMPVGRNPLRADMILFVGLGPFDTFDGAVQSLVAENVIRTFIRTRVDDFATLLLGAGSGLTAAESLRNLLGGFVEGLRDADREHRFRGVTLCERDPARYAEMKRELLRLASTPLFDGVEVTFEEIRLAAPEPAPARRPSGLPDPVYLLVRQQPGLRGSVELSCSVLGAGAAAAVMTRLKRFSARELERRLEAVESRRLAHDALGVFGGELAALILHEDVITALGAMQDRHVVVVHDRPSSRIPWETLSLGGWAPAAGHGLSRRYIADNLSVAKWLEQRRQGPILAILLVTNPTGDLAAAQREGDIVRKLFGAHPSVKVHELRGKDGTKERLRAEFQSGRYDVIHYAGHARFDRANPARSGIICHGGEILSGMDLAGMGGLPSLVFFNACEAGQLRGPAEREDLPATLIEKSSGLAEAFLRGGVANYLGTYWPVEDASAARFADAFYGRLVKGESIGQALSAGRKAVMALPSVDWADYIHYGSYEFALKRQPSS